jgi:hypothetical protein
MRPHAPQGAQVRKEGSILKQVLNRIMEEPKPVPIVEPKKEPISLDGMKSKMKEFKHEPHQSKDRGAREEDMNKLKSLIQEKVTAPGGTPPKAVVQTPPPPAPPPHTPPQNKEVPEDVLRKILE